MPSRTRGRSKVVDSFGRFDAGVLWFGVNYWFLFSVPRCGGAAWFATAVALDRRCAEQSTAGRPRSHPWNREEESVIWDVVTRVDHVRDPAGTKPQCRSTGGPWMQRAAARECLCG